MRQHHPNVKLVFAGHGPMQEGLQQRCPQAIFTGSLGHFELAGCYASADLLLFPSLTETFGNVTLEALASGLPVLAFNTAAASDWVVHGQNGWRVDGASTEAFAAQAATLARQPLALAASRCHARAQVAQLGWPQIAAQVEEVLLEVMARSYRPAQMPVADLVRLR
jgi:glycosyltransferase involved in cell wall biosynthesis